MIKAAINGFGRIGRQAFKIALEHDDIEIVAINDLSNARALAYLLKYDSPYGEFDYSLGVKEGKDEISLDDELTPIDFGYKTESTDVSLMVNGKEVKVFAEKDPTNLPWKNLGVDVVLECTGFFTKDGTARTHIQAGAKRVVVSAPTKGGDVMTFLRGVNHDAYDKNDVISNASCTTNCITPVARIIENAFGIEKAMLTTIHATTATQNLVDGLPSGGKTDDMRRGRSAYVNIVPTSTGAAKASKDVIPSLGDRFDGIAVRVPVITGSLSDLTFLLKKDVTVEEVNAAFITASEDPYYEGVLRVTYDPIVSSDIIGDPHSSIVDLSATMVVAGNLLKVLAWYDNEWGYSNRLVEMAIEVGKTA
ncbi:type I glyceraldehyde-3-phosphate dehydrogenase [candidate division WWE3 bacterium]|uniref:Glyceraldehyde-3-phosphate dehydrogenase n=1 Tax=candidate division WWE3 bacterium TaxID=2053526 RepID=A0A955LHB8_UNCKA|nr:type I glyceraldehyde-3-phosphate dehydrogenase [candidate division WWE3 bacterium]